MDSSKARVTVIGSYAVGMTISCPRFPAPGETMPGRNFKMLHGGKGSNQAIAVARLGGAVQFGGAVGADSFGRAALAMLRSEGIGTEFVVCKEKLSTGVGIVIVADSGSNEIVIDLAANEALSPQDVERMRDTIAASQFLLIQLETNLEAVVRAIEIAREVNVPVILNPAPMRKLPDAVIAAATYITPNETEAAGMLGISASDVPEGRGLASRLYERFGNFVVVTLGENGAYVRTANVDRHVPAISADCVDTTGSGHTFAGALAVALGEGRELVDAVVFANVAAGISVEVEGVVESIPYRAQVDARFARRSA
jgi:ribokinase